MKMITILLVSLATALFVTCAVGAGGLMWMWRRYLVRRRVHTRLSHGFASSGACCGCGAPRITKPRRMSRVAGSPESRLEALQRRFVSGKITLDEYERGIDRLEQLAAPH